MKLHTLTISIIAVLLYSCDYSSVDTTNTAKASLGDKLIDTGETYYWFKGEKVFLKPCANKTYIVLRGKKELQKAAAAGSLRNYKFHDVNMVKYAETNSGTHPEKEELSWTIVDLSQGQVKRSVTANNIYYSSPLYTTESGSEIGISHLFYVKMADESQISKIEELASKYNVKVIGRDKYLPLWCTLSCSIESHGNTLEIMKLLHDCGEFEAVEPDIMTDLL